MGTFENDQGKGYAQRINGISRRINDLIDTRRKLLNEMNLDGWFPRDLRRDPEHREQKYFPVIKSIRRVDTVTLEIK